MNLKLRAFTLIELLIVVAIIAILAAIAVPNFLEAQVRSKVSRVKSDMRSVTTALESYSIDNNNRYPPVSDVGKNPALTGATSGFHARISSYLTTPVAYMTSLPLDPFVTHDNTWWNNIYPRESQVGQRFAYYNMSNWSDPVAGSGPYQILVQGSDVWNGLIDWVGMWMIYSYGPDKTPFHGAAATLLPYDPTNGTVSAGNIVRCQKSSDGTPVHPITGTFNWN